MRNDIDIETMAAAIAVAIAQTFAQASTSQAPATPEPVAEPMPEPQAPRSFVSGYAVSTDPADVYAAIRCAITGQTTGRLRGETAEHRAAWKRAGLSGVDRFTLRAIAETDGKDVAQSVARDAIPAAYWSHVAPAVTPERTDVLTPRETVAETPRKARRKSPGRVAQAAYMTDCRNVYDSLRDAGVTVTADVKAETRDMLRAGYTVAETVASMTPRKPRKRSRKA